LIVRNVLIVKYISHHIRGYPGGEQGANNFLTQFHDFSTMAAILTVILFGWTQHQEEQSDVAEKPSLVAA